MKAGQPDSFSVVQGKIELDTLKVREKPIQEQIEDKILGEILNANDFQKRYQLIQQLELLSRALITIKDRKDR